MKQIQTEIEALKKVKQKHVIKLYAYTLNAQYPINYNYMYILQAETVSPLRNGLAAQKLIPRLIYKAPKPQASGLFPGTVIRKIHLLSFLYVLYLYVVYNALQTHPVLIVL